MWRLEGAVAVGDGHAAVAAEVARGDFDAGGRLAALVFVAVNEIDNLLHRVRVEPHCDDVVEGVVVLHIRLQYGVKDAVWRQGVFVLLVGAEFGAGGLVYDALWDDRLVSDECSGNGRVHRPAAWGRP